MERFQCWCSWQDHIWACWLHKAFMRLVLLTWQTTISVGGVSYHKYKGSKASWKSWLPGSVRSEFVLWEFSHPSSHVLLLDEHLNAAKLCNNNPEDGNCLACSKCGTIKSLQEREMFRIRLKWNFWDFRIYSSQFWLPAKLSPEGIYITRSSSYNFEQLWKTVSVIWSHKFYVTSPHVA